MRGKLTPAEDAAYAELAAAAAKLKEAQRKAQNRQTGKRPTAKLRVYKGVARD